MSPISLSLCISKSCSPGEHASRVNTALCLFAQVSSARNAPPKGRPNGDSSVSLGCQLLNLLLREAVPELSDLALPFCPRPCLSFQHLSLLASFCLLICAWSSSLIRGPALSYVVLLSHTWSRSLLRPLSTHPDFRMSGSCCCCVLTPFKSYSCPLTLSLPVSQPPSSGQNCVPP